MNLVAQAEADLSFTLEDKDNGFGIKIVLIGPDNTRYGDDGELIAQTTDIGFRIDPQTGSLIVGRTAEINLRLSTIISVIGSLPDKTWKAELSESQPRDISDGRLRVISDGTTRGLEIVKLWAFREGALIDRQLGIYKIVLQVLEVE